MTNYWRYLLSLILISLLIGCAKSTTEFDPYEPLNRKIFAFNTRLDKMLLKPTAKFYHAVTPPPLQKATLNIFNNIDEIPTVANSLLQADFDNAAFSTWRLLINSTVGVFGIFDVAKHMGLKENHQDFGMTLTKWGIKKSNYIVLPLLGPSTTRDGVGHAVDNLLFNPYLALDPEWLRYTLFGFNVIVRRANLLDADQLMAGAIIDPYVLQRDAYLQYRHARTFGEDPEHDEDPYIEDETNSKPDQLKK